MNKTITFRYLFSKNSQNTKKISIIYYLSTLVKNLDTYYKHKDEEIDFSYDEYKKYIKIIEQEPDKPIERIIKKTYFKQLELEVFDDVFIPRWETEQLIDIVTKLIKEENLTNLNYIDICSGTGAIGISTFLNNKQQIYSLTFLDISEQACKNIEKNLNKHKIQSKIINEDWFLHLSKNKYELITSNFPYVDHADEKDPLIKQYEPQLALFASDKGWHHYQQMIKHLKKNSDWKLVVLECSEFHQELWQSTIYKYKKWKFKTYTDVNNKFRFVSILRNV